MSNLKGQDFNMEIHKRKESPVSTNGLQARQCLWEMGKDGGLCDTIQTLQLSVQRKAGSIINKHFFSHFIFQKLFYN